MTNVDVDVESVLAQALPASQISTKQPTMSNHRLHLHSLSKPHYDFLFRPFALENHLLNLDVANADQKSYFKRSNITLGAISFIKLFSRPGLRYYTTIRCCHEAGRMLISIIKICN